MPSVYPIDSESAKYLYQWGKYIGIYPTPTEIKPIRMHYVRKPLTLQATAASTVPEILSENNRGEFADTLILYATAQIMRRLNPQVYTLLKGEFLAEKDRFISNSKVYNEEIIQVPHKDV